MSHRRNNYDRSDDYDNRPRYFQNYESASRQEGIDSNYREREREGWFEHSSQLFDPRNHGQASFSGSVQTGRYNSFYGNDQPHEYSSGSSTSYQYHHDHRRHRESRSPRHHASRRTPTREEKYQYHHRDRESRRREHSRDPSRETRRLRHSGDSDRERGKTLRFSPEPTGHRQNHNGRDRDHESRSRNHVMSRSSPNPGERSRHSMRQSRCDDRRRSPSKPRAYQENRDRRRSVSKPRAYRDDRDRQTRARSPIPKSSREYRPRSPERVGSIGSKSPRHPLSSPQRCKYKDFDTEPHPIIESPEFSDVYEQDGPKEHISIPESNSTNTIQSDSDKLSHSSSSPSSTLTRKDTADSPASNSSESSSDRSTSSSSPSVGNSPFSLDTENEKPYRPKPACHRDSKTCDCREHRNKGSNNQLQADAYTKAGTSQCNKLLPTSPNVTNSSINESVLNFQTNNEVPEKHYEEKEYLESDMQPQSSQNNTTVPITHHYFSQHFKPVLDPETITLIEASNLDHEAERQGLKKLFDDTEILLTTETKKLFCHRQQRINELSSSITPVWNTVGKISQVLHDTKMKCLKNYNIDEHAKRINFENLKLLKNAQPNEI